MGKADRYQKLYPVTWDQLHRDAKALAWRLLEQGPFKGIIGVARGGLVPAAIVARELNIRLVDTLCICTYQGREQTGGEEVLKAIEGDGDGWLVVDDLVDTGNTATIIRNMLPKAHFATLYSKPPESPSWTPSSPKSAKIRGFFSRGTPKYSIPPRWWNRTRR